MSRAARLAFHDVACMRGGRLLFEAMSFTLDAGDAAIVTGPNGTGKSSLLRQSAGLLPAAAGRIERDGRIGLAGDQHALDPALPLGDALAFWADMDGVSRGRVTDALDATALAGLADVPVRMLSTGQAKRAGLARLIAGNADIWLLDEPANGLDAASLDLLAAAMAAHRAAGGVVLAASHQPLGLANADTIRIGG